VEPVEPVEQPGQGAMGEPVEPGERAGQGVLAAAAVAVAVVQPPRQIKTVA